VEAAVLDEDFAGLRATDDDAGHAHFHYSVSTTLESVRTKFHLTGPAEGNGCMLPEFWGQNGNPGFDSFP
jgi:hypothetical protein